MDDLEPFTEEGIAVNSGPFDGLPTPEFKKKITAWLTESGLGAGKVNYKLRDWLFSRQRYWGEPFPILHEIDADGKPTGVVEPLAPEELPLRLPDLEDFKPSGRPEPPLGKRRPTGSTSRGTASATGVRRTPCRSGPDRAGTTCATSIRTTIKPFAIRKKRNTGCRLTSTSAGPNMRSCTCCIRVSGIKCCSTAATSITPEPFQKLVNQGMILGEMSSLSEVGRTDGQPADPHDEMHIREKTTTVRFTGRSREARAIIYKGKPNSNWIGRA